LSYTGVDNYGGYFTISNNAKRIIFRTESSDADMRFLLGGFPIDQHQKMILDKDGNLGIGVPDPVSKVQVKGGDIYLEDIEGGVIMRSQDQSCWRLTVSNGGDPVFTKVDPCPN
ncbi:MAG: hypothetical protein KDC53_20035, partial [Saprospiraceae bacterium]|nr:hypothetical protein [Saprospiraceae bacterium]